MLTVSLIALVWITGAFLVCGYAGVATEKEKLLQEREQEIAELYRLQDRERGED